MTAQGDDLKALEQNEYETLMNMFTVNASNGRKKSSVGFLKEYGRESVLVRFILKASSNNIAYEAQFQRARFRPESEINWLISNDSLLALKTQLNDIRLQYATEVRKFSKQSSQAIQA